VRERSAKTFLMHIAHLSIIYVTHNIGEYAHVRETERTLRSSFITSIIYYIIKKNNVAKNFNPAYIVNDVCI